MEGRFGDQPAHPYQKRRARYLAAGGYDGLSGTYRDDMPRFRHSLVGSRSVSFRAHYASSGYLMAFRSGRLYTLQIAQDTPRSAKTRPQNQSFHTT